MWYTTLLCAKAQLKDTGEMWGKCRSPDLWVVCNLIYKLIAEVGRVRIQYSHPLQAFKLAQLSHQLGKPLAIPSIHACKGSPHVALSCTHGYSEHRQQM